MRGDRDPDGIGTIAAHWRGEKQRGSVTWGTEVWVMNPRNDGADRGARRRMPNLSPPDRSTIISEDILFETIWRPLMRQPSVD